jgi:hypothetical protein
MTLTDTGPLVALIDKRDPNHIACMQTSQQLPPGPLVTTWPCLTEAMYLLGKVGGHHYQEKLWKLRSAGRLVLHELSFAETDRVEALMARYSNVPMDLADASLMVAAESLSLLQIFSIDSDFYIYRLADGSTLKVVP